MFDCYLLLVVFCFIVKPVISSWEFAISSKGRINFYTSDWKWATSAAHQFDEMTALAFDEVDETLYFNDQIHFNETIFSLKLSSNQNYYVERIVNKTKDEKVQGIAFDPLERTLYWTDVSNGAIYHMNMNGEREPSVLIKLGNSKRPHGIAIDVCRRKLYWTNANVMSSSIERISLDGSNYEILIEKDLYMPRGIVVDQHTQRIFWVDDLPGEHFSVESANLDGSDRKDLVRMLYHVPFDVAVDESNVYWTDEQDSAIWQISKNATVDDQPMKVLNFTDRSVPKGIIVRNHFLSAQANDADCRSVINVIKSSILTTPASSLPHHPDTAAEVPPLTHRADTVAEASNGRCLNNGHFDVAAGSCQCPYDFKGEHCEIPKCHNYCVEGTCAIASSGNPICKCRLGFSGDRCENDVCNNYCLNGGRCMMESGERSCQCPTSFFGQRCENMNVEEMCTRYCNKEDFNVENVDFETVCNNCSKNGTIPWTSRYGFSGEHANTCKESLLNKTAIFVSSGVVISLALVFLIIKTIRHVYKPLRPRIKKTYVVHKNVVPTPLCDMQCRPSTEQCEITIENCCNMNICDTPCFDPKVLQAEANKKEDKKILLNNSDDLLY